MIPEPSDGNVIPPVRVVPDKHYRHIASGFLAPVPVEQASRQTTGDAINVLG